MIKLPDYPTISDLRNRNSMFCRLHDIAVHSVLDKIKRLKEEFNIDPIKDINEQDLYRFQIEYLCVIHEELQKIILDASMWDVRPIIIRYNKDGTAEFVKRK